MVRLAASPQRRAACRGRKAGFEKARGRGERRKGRKARRTLFGLHTQCRRAPCARLRLADRCFASRMHRCAWKDFQIFWEESVCSKLWEAFVCEGQPSLNALGPRATSGARSTTASSRNSLPALNAAGVVQAPQSVQRVQSKRAVASLGRRKMSVMKRRNSLPPLNEMTTVQAPRPYSVSGANGRLRYSGVGRASENVVRHAQALPDRRSRDGRIEGVRGESFPPKRLWLFLPFYPLVTLTRVWLPMAVTRGSESLSRSGE